MTRERMQPRKIGALLVLVTGLALLPSLHAHLPGAALPDGVAIAASEAGDVARDASPPCPLCRASAQTRFATESGRAPLPLSPPVLTLRLPAAEQPAAVRAPLLLGAPPRAPPSLLS